MIRLLLTSSSFQQRQGVTIAFKKTCKALLHLLNYQIISKINNLKGTKKICITFCDTATDLFVFILFSGYRARRRTRVTAVHRNSYFPESLFSVRQSPGQHLGAPCNLENGIETSAKGNLFLDISPLVHFYQMYINEINNAKQLGQLNRNKQVPLNCN